MTPLHMPPLPTPDNELTALPVRTANKPQQTPPWLCSYPLDGAVACLNEAVKTTSQPGTPPSIHWSTIHSPFCSYNTYLFKVCFFFNVYGWFCLHVCLYTVHTPEEGQKSVREPRGWELELLLMLYRCWDMNPRSCGRAASNLNHRRTILVAHV